jgi:hypothetical protein
VPPKFSENKCKNSYQSGIKLTQILDPSIVRFH